MTGARDRLSGGGRCGREVDDLADGGGFFVSGHDRGAWLDLAGVTGLVEEGPDVERAVIRRAANLSVSCAAHVPKLEVR